MHATGSAAATAAAVAPVAPLHADDRPPPAGPDPIHPGHQQHAQTDHRQPAAEPTSAGPHRPLLQLPVDVMHAVLARLLPADRAALRAASRAGRAAANARVGTLTLRARDFGPGGGGGGDDAPRRLAERFPLVKEVRLTLDGSDWAAAAAGPHGADPQRSSQGAVLQEPDRRRRSEGNSGSGSQSSSASGSPNLTGHGLLQPPPPAAQLPGRFAGSCTVSGGLGGGAGAAPTAFEQRVASVLQACAPEVGPSR
jgi:hypothetical protein